VISVIIVFLRRAGSRNPAEITVPLHRVAFRGGRGLLSREPRDCTGRQNHQDRCYPGVAAATARRGAVGFDPRLFRWAGPL